MVTGQLRERRISAEPEDEVAALLPCCKATGKLSSSSYSPVHDERTL